MPALIKAGWSEQQLFDCLRERYDADVPDREIEGVINYCFARISAEYDTTVNKAELAKRVSELQMLTARTARSLSSEILWKYQWPEANIATDSPVSIPNDPLAQMWAFLAMLWQPDDRLWFGGTTTESGVPKHARNFMNINDAYWRIRDGWRPEFVSQCTFQLGTFSRCDKQVMTRKYFVVESDIKNGGLDRNEIGAVFRWLDEVAGFRLRAVVFSGNASLHGWFEWQPSQSIDELRAVIRGLRCDPMPLTTTQPVRLAGARRANTNNLQTLLYLS